MAKSNLRETIVDAVGRVVARHGLPGTTIDAVAKEAGVSKGGVLYHFPTRLAMILAMIDRYEEDFLARREKVLADLPERPLNLLRATVMVMLADLDATQDIIPNHATVLDEEEPRRHVGEFKRRVLAEVSRDCENPEKIALVLFIVDGMWMDVRFNPPIISASDRAAAMKELLAYVDSLSTM